MRTYAHTCAASCLRTFTCIFVWIKIALIHITQSLLFTYKHRILFARMIYETGQIATVTRIDIESCFPSICCFCPLIWIVCALKCAHSSGSFCNRCRDLWVTRQDIHKLHHVQSSYQITIRKNHPALPLIHRQPTSFPRQRNSISILILASDPASQRTGN